MSDTGAADAAKAGAADPAAAPPDFEGRARRMGWRPKEEFRGDASRWTDAQTFVERGEAELPVLRERYRALDDRFAKLENTTTSEAKELKQRLGEMAEVLGEFRERSGKAEERAYQRAKAELQAQMDAAVQTADQEGYRRARVELERLEESRPEPAAAKPAKKKDDDPAAKPAPKVEPEVEAWVRENDWFNRDPKMRAYATEYHGELLRDKPGLNMHDNLAEVKREVMARFPEKFENARRDAPAAVASPSAPAAKRKGGIPAYAEWPQDAKDGYQRFKKTMPDYKPEEYAKIYFAGDES